MAANDTRYTAVPQNERKSSSSSDDKPDARFVKKDDDVVCLKPKMGLFNGITVIVGSIIGSGIFVSPKGVLLGTGSVGMSLVVWIISGVFSMIGAYCYAELGCTITKSGADYAYIMDSFGPFVAFLRLWVECMIVRPCSQAVVALTFSFYVLRPLYPDCEPPDPSIRLLACVCIFKMPSPKFGALDKCLGCSPLEWALLVSYLYPYSLDLASKDFHFFLYLNHFLSKRTISDAAVYQAVDDFIASREPEFFKVTMNVIVTR